MFVHRLVTLGTIEEKMEALKEKKRTVVAVALVRHGGTASPQIGLGGIPAHHAVAW